jgi:hypothetical protein
MEIIYRRLTVAMHCARIALMSSVPGGSDYQRAWIVRAKVEAIAAIPSSFGDGLSCVRLRADVRWSAISRRSGCISPTLSFMAHLLPNLDRLFGSFSRNRFLFWHYSRIRNHFRDVDRL